MAATQNSTQSVSQTQKSEIWQNEVAEAQTDSTEISADPFPIHHTEITIIQEIYPTRRRRTMETRNTPPVRHATFTPLVVVTGADTPQSILFHRESAFGEAYVPRNDSHAR